MTSLALVTVFVLAQAPVKLPVEHLPNAYRVTDKVISGGLPEDEAGFNELERLGVKTIISVDGMRPDVETAKRHGMRYVHLPHGYDSVPEKTAHALAKAVRDLPGPVYIHCHHGKHRSPAASAVACVEAGLLAPSDALAVLKQAGTGANYRGLYASARQATPLSRKFLDDFKVEFSETAKVPPLAEAMVSVEHAHDRLMRSAAAGWKFKNVDAAHEALLLEEGLREMLRAHGKSRPEKFVESMRACEKAASELRESLESLPPMSEKAKTALAAVTAQCAACHRDFRDNVQR